MLASRRCCTLRTRPAALALGLVLVLVSGTISRASAQGHAVRARGTFDLDVLALEIQASQVEGLVFLLRPQHWAPLGDTERWRQDGYPPKPERASDADWHWARVTPDSATAWVADARQLLRDEPRRHAAVRTKRARFGTLPPPPSGPVVALAGVDGALVTIGVDTLPSPGLAAADGFLTIRSGWNTPATAASAPRATLLDLLDSVERGLAYARWLAPQARTELACAAAADGEPNLQPPTLVEMPTPAMNPQFPYRMQVFFEYAVDEEGRVVPASIRELHGDAPRWSDAVRKALAKARYRPARVDGEPVVS